MLSAINAVPNASVTASQGTNAVVVAENLTRLTSSAALVSDLEDQGAASAIKGKLSILLIAARERMIDSLFAAIDAAGKAISVTPLPGESRVNYAARVADKIVSLSPQNVVIAERQLSQQGQNVPLNVIAAALKNPGGSEAAAVIGYLETARYKDRDLATRAVMRSYRQNDSSPFRPAVSDPEIAVLARAVETSAEPRGASLKQASPALAQAPGAQASIAPPAPQDIAAVLAEGIDGAMTAAVDDEAVIESKLYPEQAAAEAEPAAENTLPDAENEPIIPEKWANVIGTISEETAEMLLAVIGDEDVQVLLEGSASEPPVELEAVIAERMDDLVEDLAGKKADLSNAAVRQTDVSGVTEQEPAIPVDAARDVKLSAFSEAQILAADPQQQAAVLSKAVLGVPLIPVPYDFDTDAPEGSDSTPVYRTHETDQDGGGQQNGQQGRPDDNEEQDEQAGINAQAMEATGEQAAADPLFALYRRMAGWE